MINLLKNTPNQPTKCKTKHWFEINEKWHGLYNNGSQIKSKVSMLKSRLCDYSDAYVLVKGRISMEGNAESLERRAAAQIEAAEWADKKMRRILKNCAPVPNCMSKISYTQIDNAKHLDVVMPVYTIIKYVFNYPKKFHLVYENIIEMK